MCFHENILYISNKNCLSKALMWGHNRWMDGFDTILQPFKQYFSHQDDEWVLIRGCVQWNPFSGLKRSPPEWVLNPGQLESALNLLSHWGFWDTQHRCILWKMRNSPDCHKIHFHSLSSVWLLYTGMVQIQVKSIFKGICWETWIVWLLSASDPTITSSFSLRFGSGAPRHVTPW